MDKVLEFQISMLGAFQNIQPNLILTQSLVDRLGGEGFIPATLEVNILDPNSKAITSDTRLQMISEDQMWSVMFFSERIDINYEYKGGEVYYRDISTVLNRAKDICEKTFSCFADTAAIRLAVNGRFSLRNMENNEKQKFINKYAVLPKAFDGEAATEWGTRYNVPVKVSFGEKTSRCNRIVEIFDFIGIDSVHHEIRPRVGVSLDFNTDQTNRELIYKYSDLLCFADAIQPTMDLLLQEIGGDEEWNR